MKLKDITFNVLVASIPVLISSFVQNEVTASSFIQICIATIASFVFLLLITCVMENFSNRIKYAGQWVIELAKEDSGAIENVGIGIIRYDHKTGEHIFFGKLFDTNATELFIWSVSALHLNRDNSTECVCITKSDAEPIALGHLRFTNENECDGAIWSLNGKQCKLNGYRLTKGKLPPSSSGYDLKLFDSLLNTSPVLRQESYSNFVLLKYKHR